MRAFAIVITAFGALLALAQPRAAPRVTIVIAAVILAAWCGERIAAIAASVPPANDRLRRRAKRVPEGVAAELADLETAVSSRHGRIDLHLRRQISLVATHRLRAHQGIDLRDTAGVDRARASVSPTLWLVIDPERDPIRSQPEVRVPMEALPAILTELEQL